MIMRTILRMLLLLTLWGSAAVAVVTGFSWMNVASARATGRIDEASAMRSVLLALMPPGSALADAEGRMEGEGFRCRSLPAYPGQLFCERSDSAGWPVSRRWQVQVLSADGHVTDMRIDMGLVGP
ncbi:hypothetical protein F8S13_11340 [Chloroflexia bacterium SDU3-3]|nr:hypothetical protein F8S13_11340 [Chloroflexia bacterium SDU3-3]